jgi:phosphate transport system permease protein
LARFSAVGRAGPMDSGRTLTAPAAQSSATLVPPRRAHETSPSTGGPAGHDGGGDGGGGGPDREPSKGTRRWLSGESVLREVLRALTLLPLAALIALVVVLLVKAIPAIRVNGWAFFTHSEWRPGNFYANPVETKGVPHPPAVSYGALPLIVGTLLSSAFALLFAVPLAVGVALIVVEKLPARISSSVGFCMEVLAGVPSVVYGLWGVLTLGPFLAHHVSPFISEHMPDVPVLSFFKGPVGSGQGLFPSSVVLAIMVIPIIAATTRDLLRQVPRQTIEGAVALGMTDSESMKSVSFPWVRAGVVGASVLGLARALGETIAIAMISGAQLGATPGNFYASFTTIAATIVSQLDSAFTDATGFAVRTLAELGLVLLVITLVANVLARLIIRRVSTTALPVGVGL